MHPEGLQTQEGLRRPGHLSRLGGGTDGGRPQAQVGPHSAQHDYWGQACMKKHGIPMSHVARQVPYLTLKVRLCVLCCSGSLTVALFLTGTWAGHQIQEL